MNKSINHKLVGPLLLVAILISGIMLGIVVKREFYSSEELKSEGEIVKGAQIYQQNCASCHGENMEGQPNWKVRDGQGRLPAPPHDKTGHTWHHADQLLFDLTKFGMVPPNIPEGYESDMPAFKDALTDDQIWAVLSYIKSRWPEETRKIQQEMTSGDSSFKKP